ncbi:MAG: alpha/beta fold hydrolase [Thermoproteota archaeon]|nr:alpha/beta fold hydrolase [Thermoproteota archaeon]
MSWQHPVTFRRPHLDDVIEMLITLSEQHLRMKTLGTVSVVASGIILIIITSIGIGPFLTLVAIAYGQQPSTNGSAIAGSTAPKKPLPVLLIHGYLSDAAVWNKWQDLLKKDGIPVFAITFQQSDDKCGSAAAHAKELSKKIGDIKSQTGQNQVNVVGHSKGGLDARVYLANGTHDVANLIMIGTPNAGSSLAQPSNTCAPAVYDLKPGAADTLVKMNPNTRYYTIAGDWNPSLGNCQLSLFLPMELYNNLPKPNDGLVPVSSVESQGYFHNLGHTNSCHTNLLSDYEYGLARDILLGKK